MTSVHFDEREDADDFIALLAGRGVRSAVHRDEFAGEDDADDAAWIVEAHEEPARLRAAAERCRGWVVEEPDVPASEPPPLPQGPRRIKNPTRARPSADG